MTAGMPKSSLYRLVALLLFIGLPVVLGAFTVLNLLQIDEDRFTILEKEARLSMMSRRLNAPAADGTPIDLASIYVTGVSRTLASANLQQQLVNSIFAAAGRLVETVSVDPVDPVDPEEAIRLKATLDIENDGLLQLLYALESGVPLIDVETLSIRNISSGESAETPSLRVDMTVSGHWRPQSTQ